MNKQASGRTADVIGKIISVAISVAIITLCALATLDRNRSWDDLNRRVDEALEKQRTEARR